MNDFYLFLGLLALGYVAGTISERLHYRSIRNREKRYLNLPAVTFKHEDVPESKIQSAQLVCGSAVISIDYFKRILALFRNIFGGTVKPYESLIDRARREAVLRMKSAADDATIIINVRIETANIGGKAYRRGVGCLEAVAYGTALKLKE